MRLLVVKSRNCLENRRTPCSEKKSQIRSRNGRLHGNCIREASSEPISRMAAATLQSLPTVTTRPPTTSNRHGRSPTKRCKPYVTGVHSEWFARSDRIFWVLRCEVSSDGGKVRNCRADRSVLPTRCNPVGVTPVHDRKKHSRAKRRICLQNLSVIGATGSHNAERCPHQDPWE
jgi:hypothetical protein